MQKAAKQVIREYNSGVLYIAIKMKNIARSMRNSTYNSNSTIIQDKQKKAPNTACSATVKL